MDVSQPAMWNAAFQHITCDHTLTVTCVQRLQCETETQSSWTDKLILITNCYGERRDREWIRLKIRGTVSTRPALKGL